MRDRRLIKRTIDSIKVGPRHRQDLGDIPSLAASIAKVGLLNPITLTSEGLLIAGERRLEACKHLGWRIIACYVTDDLESAATKLTAERDENTERKEMTPEELVNLGLALEELERPKAKGRQGARTDLDKHRSQVRPMSTESDESPKNRNSTRTNEIVGDAIGLSRTTYARAKAVVKAANDESLNPKQQAVAKQALAEMNASGIVSTSYNKILEITKPQPTLSKRKSTSAEAREQRYAFERGLPSMSGTVMLLQRIEKINSEITDDELDQWIKSLSDTRRNIEQIIRRLKDKKNAQVS